MPESLQQKVDRMTAGMEPVSVVVDGMSSGTYTIIGRVVSTELTQNVLFVGGARVRMYNGKVNHRITAIDMPDPECPFEMGARVRVAGHGWVYIVAGWDYYDAWKAWFVRAEVESERESHGLWRPDDLTLVPPDPAPFQPGDKVRWNANTRADNDDRENRKTVARCEKVGGYWRVYYVRDADERYDRWDFADGLELAPEPAEPDCPAVLVTYTDGRQEAKALSVGDGGVRYYGSVVLRRWLGSSQVATVQALRPAEYLRGGA